MRKTSLLVLLAFVVASFVMLATSSKSTAQALGYEDRGPLTKITFIHYKKANAKGGSAGGSAVGAKTSCYKFLASGAKWKAVEGYYVNPANGDELSDTEVFDAVGSSIATWESSAGNIVGSLNSDHDVSYVASTTDNKNTVSFGAYTDPGVIGVTNVWGYFYGPPRSRELVEWDMLLNDSFDWGNGASDPTLMDAQNIITHELGHALGLGDLYETSCTLETMFGYSTESETDKRTLNDGDIAGIQKLY